MPDLEVSRLEPGSLAMAYPLLRAATRIPLADWQAFGESLLASGGEIVAVTADSGCILGLMAFRRTRTLRAGSTLKVEVFESFDLSASMPVRTALWETLDEIAAAEGCESVIFRGVETAPGIRSGSRSPAERRRW